MFHTDFVPMANGEFRWVGKVGRDWTLEQGKAAAREVALNLLSQLKTALDGDLDKVVRAVKLNGFVNCTDDFIMQPAVINGASDLMIEVFGDAGRHARVERPDASTPPHVPAWRTGG